MIKFISLAITAMLAENLLCSRALGLETALREEKDFFRFGLLTTVATTLMSLVAWLFDFFLLARYHLEFLRLFIYIPLIFVIVWAMEKVPFFAKFIGKFKTALRFNTAIVGIAVISAVKTYPLYSAVLFGFFSGIGYTAVLVLLDMLCNKISANELPKSFSGMPIKLIIIALMSLAAMAFRGGVTL